MKIKAGECGDVPGRKQKRWRQGLRRRREKQQVGWEWGWVGEFQLGKVREGEKKSHEENVEVSLQMEEEDDGFTFIFMSE